MALPGRSAPARSFIVRPRQSAVAPQTSTQRLCVFRPAPRRPPASRFTIVGPRQVLVVTVTPNPRTVVVFRPAPARPPVARTRLVGPKLSATTPAPRLVHVYTPPRRQPPAARPVLATRPAAPAAPAGIPAARTVNLFGVRRATPPRTQVLLVGPRLSAVAPQPSTDRLSLYLVRPSRPPATRTTLLRPPQAPATPAVVFQDRVSFFARPAAPWRPARPFVVRPGTAGATPGRPLLIGGRQARRPVARSFVVRQQQTPVVPLVAAPRTVNLYACPRQPPRPRGCLLVGPRRSAVAPRPAAQLVHRFSVWERARLPRSRFVICRTPPAVVQGPTRDLRVLVGAPVAKWVERGPARKWTAGQPVVKWTIRGPVRKWRIGGPVRKWPPGPPTP